MINLEPLVSTYGYPALLVGTFLEGETILVIAGFLAHRGYCRRFPGNLLWRSDLFLAWLDKRSEFSDEETLLPSPG